RAVNREAAEALRHRRYSVGNPRHSPTYDMSLNLIRTIRLEGSQGPSGQFFTGSGGESLSVTVLDPQDSENVELWLDIKSELLDEVGGPWVLEHFRTLAESAIARPEAPLFELAMVSPAERWQSAVGWNQTTANLPGGRLLHRMVESQVVVT